MLLKNVLNNFIEIAVGEENGKWYVQTTDVLEHTHISEPIEEELETKLEALAIARHYAKRFDLKIQEWD